MSAKSGLFKRIITRAGKLPPLATAVVHPVDAESLRGAAMAWRRGLIVPVLVGPEARIRRAATEAGISLRGLRIVATEHSHAAADAAVTLAREGRVACLMKGSLHTDELMDAVLTAGGNGLRTARRVSHVFVLDVPAYPKALLITDAAINISPDLEAKRDIVQNAIDLAHAIGIAHPRVAILSAVETVTARIPSTLDAAALCKMADRGQITGGILDGPLAFDNAISDAARRAKHIVSPVAGRPDILVVPDLEAGNMLVKQLQYFGGARGAGIVLGTRVPIALTSRADPAEARLASCAIAVLARAHGTKRKA
jgi:phosphate acetyltransferase/phosphate butyryltransferase